MPEFSFGLLVWNMIKNVIVGNHYSGVAFPALISLPEKKLSYIVGHSDGEWADTNTPAIWY